MNSFFLENFDLLFGEALRASFLVGIPIFILFFLFWIVLIGGMIFMFVFWILMIVDVAKREFKTSDERLLWIIVMILGGWVGAIIYYLVVKHPEKKASRNPTASSIEKHHS
jgi:uncharacterized membrane protein YsdA (DUF1294 family)